jgi:hypothetical protein
MTATWTTISSGAIGDQFTADIFNDIVDNLSFLRDPPHFYYALPTGAANLTTSSTTFVTITNFTGSITTQGNPIAIEFMARVNTTNSRFDILVDGVSITADNDGLGSVSPISTFGNVYIKRLVAVSAGAHTVTIQWRSTSGTITLYAAGLGQMIVTEIGDLS